MIVPSARSTPVAGLARAGSLVVRELRQESRRSVNFWLRVLAAGLMVAVFGWFTSTTELTGAQLGPELFGWLQVLLRLALWIIVPLMTADCISQERREGTLPLLFLTPLTVAEVLAGKAAVHAFRGFTLWLAALPLLVLPFVLGGVGPADALVAVADEIPALVLGLAVGLYTSVAGGTSHQVMARALALALVLAAVDAFGSLFVWDVMLLFFDSANGKYRLVGWGLGPWLLARMVFTGGAFVILLDLASRRLRRNWGAYSPSAQPAWTRTFAASPFWRRVFRWPRGPALDRNPIAWLQEYSWTARLTKWGWCGLILLAGPFLSLNPVACPPTLLLSFGVALSAVGSFRRERAEGLFEILLVTPLPARQLVLGRLWGLACHYFPAYAVVVVYWRAVVLLTRPASGFRDGLSWLPNPLALATLMLFGLWLSFQRSHVLLLWLFAWAGGYLLPNLLATELGARLGWSSRGILLCAALLQVALALVSWRRLLAAVRERSFLRAVAA